MIIVFAQYQAVGQKQWMFGCVQSFGLEALTVATMGYTLLWDVATFHRIEIYSSRRDKVAGASNSPLVCWVYTSTLNMETTISSEISLNYTSRLYISLGTNVWC
jgi:hypothetical protein